MQKMFFLLFIIFLSNLLQATAIDVTKTSQSLLTQGHLYFDREARSFEDIKTRPFTSHSENHMNRAFDAKTAIWVALDFVNESNTTLERILELNNPLLEHITLFDGIKIEQSGMLHVKADEIHIYPYFHLSFKPHVHQTLWLKIENRTTTLQFELLLKSVAQFHHDDLERQNAVMFFLGLISAFLLLSILLYFYIREPSYIYYSFYLLMILFQQMTYVGFLPLHAPLWFTSIDNLLVVPKVGMLIIAAAWYAMHFLGVEKFPKIRRGYQLFIWVLFIQMPLVGTVYFYLPEVTVLTGFLFVLFNTFAGSYIYLQGYKQVRFFIAGWLVLVVAYLVLIMDSLGFISVMHAYPNLLLWATALEAVLLLMAFVDRFSLLQHEKKQLHEALVLEYNLRQNIIEKEVEEKTDELSKTLQQKELLFRELHHRTKNNLQLIMSLIRLQGDHARCDEESDILAQLEGRIGAIARTHELLYQQHGDEMVDMAAYVDSYIEGMDASLQDMNITLTCSEVEVHLPLREAVYVGLIINELVSNALKYAYDAAGGVVHIRLKAVGDVYTLEVCDEGKGYNQQTKKTDTLGLSLVKSLVEEQLDGTLAIEVSKGTHYIMRFVI